EGVEYGQSAYGYIEFVLGEGELRRQRRYNDQDTYGTYIQSTYSGGENGGKGEKDGGEKKEKENKDQGEGTKAKAKDEINICIMSSNNLDGQKSIWLQQIRHLSSLTLSNGSRYSFTWLLTLEDGHSLREPEQVNTV
ncbi:hypothetical protein B484DRAFT_397158, partial [Ochromonadaceae sp. CCMP2298]